MLCTNVYNNYLGQGFIASSSHALTPSLQLDKESLSQSVPSVAFTSLKGVRKAVENVGFQLGRAPADELFSKSSVQKKKKNPSFIAYGKGAVIYFYLLSEKNQDSS